MVTTFESRIAKLRQSLHEAVQSNLGNQVHGETRQRARQESQARGIASEGPNPANAFLRESLRKGRQLRRQADAEIRALRDEILGTVRNANGTQQKYAQDIEEEGNRHTRKLAEIEDRFGPSSAAGEEVRQQLNDLSDEESGFGREKRSCQAIQIAQKGWWVFSGSTCHWILLLVLMCVEVIFNYNGFSVITDDRYYGVALAAFFVVVLAIEAHYCGLFIRKLFPPDPAEARTNLAPTSPVSEKPWYKRAFGRILLSIGGILFVLFSLGTVYLLALMRQAYFDRAERDQQFDPRRGLPDTGDDASGNAAEIALAAPSDGIAANGAVDEQGFLQSLQEGLGSLSLTISGPGVPVLLLSLIVFLFAVGWSFLANDADGKFLAHIRNEIKWAKKQRKLEASHRREVAAASARTHINTEALQRAITAQAELIEEWTRDLLHLEKVGPQVDLEIAGTLRDLIEIYEENYTPSELAGTQPLLPVPDAERVAYLRHQISQDESPAPATDGG